MEAHSEGGMRIKALSTRAVDAGVDTCLISVVAIRKTQIKLPTGEVTVRNRVPAKERQAFHNARLPSTRIIDVGTWSVPEAIIVADKLLEGGRTRRLDTDIFAGLIVIGAVKNTRIQRPTIVLTHGNRYVTEAGLHFWSTSRSLAGESAIRTIHPNALYRHLKLFIFSIRRGGHACISTWRVVIATI